ncbi:MAG TPA: hypothetical protein VEK57_24290 [Thermoanaerobaculia bacterium]|nr:hypothetical protein [Thermoanaerobaculia bacterium]
MSITKGPTEGGGKRGHSNTERWGTHQEIKAATKPLRRLEEKSTIREAMNETDEQLEGEAEQLTKLLASKRVKVIWRHRSSELGIEFTDGTRLFVNATAALEFSVE